MTMKRIGIVVLFALSVTGYARTEERTAWFRQAKFGMFIHWGLYAIPAGEWNGQAVPGIGEWIMLRAKIPVAEYAALAGKFNPVKFNADEWVQIAKDAGMGYVAITSKHHDGFALFQSKASSYNIVDATPFRRDVISELSAACRRGGLRFGCYYSQSQDWHHPGGAVAANKTWDPSQQGDFDQYLGRIALPQVKELLTRYGAISLIWFDTPQNMTEERVRPFVEAIRTLQPACLINSRLLLRGSAIKDLTPEAVAKAIEAGCDYISRGDNEIPPVAVPGCWETPATLNDTWGFKKDDHNWKTPETILYKLVDIVSKGGNYLLNVGPDATGVIPEPSVKVLRAVGAWMKINGEAIHNAGPTPFGQEFGDTVEEKNEYGRKVTVSSLRVWRCTTQPGKLYFHIFEWPANGRFEVTNVRGKVARAQLLAAPSQKSLRVTQTGDKLLVQLPARPSTPAPVVVRVELAGN